MTRSVLALGAWLPQFALLQSMHDWGRWWRWLVLLDWQGSMLRSLHALVVCICTYPVRFGLPNSNFRHVDIGCSELRPDSLSAGIPSPAHFTLNPVMPISAAMSGIVPMWMGGKRWNCWDFSLANLLKFLEYFSLASLLKFWEYFGLAFFWRVLRLAFIWRGPGEPLASCVLATYSWVCRGMTVAVKRHL